jgi:hypothetical protein
MKPARTLITASIAALLAVSPVIADEHRHGGGGSGNGWHGGGQQWHGGAWHEHHGGECGWSCSPGLGAFALSGVLAALLYYAPPPVFYPPSAYVQTPVYHAPPPAQRPFNEVRPFTSTATPPM